MTDEFEKIPNPILPTLKSFFTSLCFFVVFMVVSSTYSIPTIFTETFSSMNILQKVVYYFISMGGYRFRYYFIFTLIECNMQSCGLGYNGTKNGNHRWDRIVGCYWWGVESANSSQVMFNKWNVCVHLWLKHYILERIQKGSKPTYLESMSTFVVSGFWHGFYPAYYVCFCTAAVLQENNKDIYRSWALWHKLIPSAYLRFGISFMLNFLCMNYCGILMLSLSAENTFFFLNQTYWYVPVAQVLLAIFFRASNLVKISKKMEAKQK